MQTALKTALSLGAAAFLIFLLIDVASAYLSLLELLIRLSIVVVLVSQALVMSMTQLSRRQLSSAAKFGMGLSMLDLFAIQLVESSPAVYGEIWVWLLPIYFFSYGQLVLAVADTLVFGLIGMLVLPFSGYLTGVAPAALLPSVTILLMVNVFGCYTRWQLESQARNLFLERRRAEEAANNKTLFIRQFSHNLRQPLQALSCYASVLEASFAGKLHEPFGQVVCKMGTAIDELNNAFNRVLDMANLEVGQQVPIPTLVDINVLMATLEDQFAPLASRRGLDFRVKLRKRPPYAIQTDPCILSQIIGNLIDNAIKYTQAGWVVMEAVNIGARRLKLHVRDSGIGIPEEQQQQIFKDFYCGQRRREDSCQHGMGIGLAYVAAAIQRLPGHELHVFSRPGQGSDFQIILPVVERGHDCERTVEQFDGDIFGSFVLIVDNESELLEALAEQTLNWGCLVQTATGLSGVKSALADNLRLPDLLITDFYLDNGETAHDIIAEVETVCGPTPTLVLSAHAIADADKAKWSDNIQLLRKPASAQRLRETMARAMGR